MPEAAAGAVGHATGLVRAASGQEGSGSLLHFML